MKRNRLAWISLALSTALAALGSGARAQRVEAKEPPQVRQVSAASYRIGVLCPLEGRFSPLGESFIKGASVALKEARLKGIENVELVIGDTRGNPLECRAVTERLIDEERVDALLGEVLSSSTIAAAQVAELAKTVLLSTVATEEGIDEIGGWIFQTTTGAETEIAAIARMACERLRLTRIAYVSSDDPGSRRDAALFASEVERLGGELCASEFYPEGTTDFADVIDRVWSRAPEALFIGSDTEDLVLILPQLSFHDFGVQLLGTSAWNSRRLLRMVGKDLEGAVFPADIDARSGEQRYLAACALVNEPPGEISQVLLGGYRGTRLLIEALAKTKSGGEPLREEMARLLEKKRHPFLDLLAGPGILFYTVRNERAVEFDTLRARH
jgi:branched-chain amino acid transport system substrate-binding protein